MSKDFYSDNHIIKIGANGSGSGELKIITESNCTIESDDAIIDANRIELNSGASIIMNSSSNLITVNADSLLGIVANSSNIICNSIIATGSNDSGEVLEVMNTSTDSSANVLKLSFNSISTPVVGNKWILFTANNSTKGSIRGADSSGGNLYTLYSATTLDFAEGVSSPSGLETTNGFVQYTSGNADFGEVIEIGNINEWGKDISIVNNIMKIQEGVVLYIRDSKVWKNGPGRAMVTTNRPILVGNENNKNPGIVMSFIGQIPVLVEGLAKDGWLLLPIKDKNHCIAVDPEDISFSDYRKAIGTVWSNKNTDNIDYVIAAIGIK